jgi:hypothetical protein
MPRTPAKITKLSSAEVGSGQQSSSVLFLSEPSMAFQERGSGANGQIIPYLLDLSEF